MKSVTLDKLHRPLRDLRISVTDRCNFRCRYCMPEEIFGPDYSFCLMIKFYLLMKLKGWHAFSFLQCKKVAYYWGEPLLRKNLPELIERLNKIDGVEDIGLTTNGSLLKKFASDLYKAGLSRVTVSLDSLEEERFAYLNGNRSKVKTVLGGIQAAAEVGMEIKVNMVVKRKK